MIVLDASAAVEMLIHGPVSDALRRALSDSNETLIAPHLLDIEVISAFRNLAIGRRIEATRVADFMDELRTLPLSRLDHTPLLDRIWELRQNFTAYDAAYIALAEAMEAVLYTCDDKLLKGHRARVRLFAQTPGS